VLPDIAVKTFWTMSAIPIRSTYVIDNLITMVACPRALHYDHEPEQTEGLPKLQGKLETGSAQPLILGLRIHNHAGIPIIKGQCRIEAGQRHFTLTDLHALGVEAYSHKPEAERAQFARRIWARRAYGTLTLTAVS
jgi:hypothetical protein